MTVEAHEVGARCRNKSDDLGDEIGRLKKLCKGAVRPGVRYVSLARLPDHETALAMTVHKSQGSQFDRIALVLPAESGSPILTRELVYTGITRAKWRVDWVGDRVVLADALRRGVGRASGLGQLLWSSAEDAAR